MPTSSEVTVETNTASVLLDNQAEQMKLSEEGLELKIEIQKKKQQPTGSPKRKFGTRHLNMSGIRQNRNHPTNKKMDNNNSAYNKQPNFHTFKGSSNLTQQNLTQNEYQQKIANGQLPDSKKTSNHKFRSITKSSQIYRYDDLSNPKSHETTSLPPFPAEFHGESAKHPYNGQSSYHSSAENEQMHRKYSMDFLHQVGYKMNATGMNLTAQNSPKQTDDPNLLAQKMALGDNSSYYNHFYSNSMYGNQVLMQQQYQPHNYSRFQQQQEMQRLQRIYPRGQQENYQRVYQPSIYVEQESPSLQCHCLLGVQQQFQSNFPQSNYQQHQHGYQHRKGDRREFHENPKKSRPAFGYQNNSDRKKDFKHRNHMNKSKSFTEDISSNRLLHHNNIRSDFAENVFRSLSPTPPNSSKSSSPSDHKLEKEAATSAESNFELVDDSLSTASSSGPSSSTEDMKVSRSAPILIVSEEPANNVNSWIDNNFGSAFHNGLSHSVEHLATTKTPVSIIKRPPPTIGLKKNNHNFTKAFNNLSYDPQSPFEYYLSRSEVTQIKSVPSGLRCKSQWDRLSEQMWEKFMVSQQSQETYTKKMKVWQELHNAVKVRKLVN